MKDIEIGWYFNDGTGRLIDGQVRLPASLLRDLYAGLASVGLMAASPHGRINAQDHARVCSDLAEAFMAERAKREGA